MKNNILVIFYFVCFCTAYGQERQIFNRINELPVVDSTTIFIKDSYYVINSKQLPTVGGTVVRQLSKGYIIIKANTTKHWTKTIGYTLDSSWKLSQRIKNEHLAPNEVYTFSVKLTKGNLPWNNLKGVRLIKGFRANSIYLINASLKTIQGKVLPLHQVVYVDIYNKKPTEESALRLYNLDVNRITTAKHLYPGVLGANKVVSLKENSIDTTDIDLLNKVTLTENSSTELTQHAKEMGTLIAGLGNSHKTGEGVVTSASLVSTNFSSLFAEDTAYFKQHNITVQNHSYGTGIENFYGNESVSYDQRALDAPNVIQVFSAGNAGLLAPEFGTYKGINGYANLTGDFKQAKNVLVVAAIDSTLQHESLTSSGPAYDGRVKPDLAAFGGEGTSESAALTSGAIAFVQDYFEQKNNRSMPISLLKAILFASSTNAHKQGIDFNTGYGALNLAKALQLIDLSYYRQDTLVAVGTYQYSMQVPTNTQELKIAINWIDPPANPEDAEALVNDLDMVVLDPNAIKWSPWVLSSYPNPDSLALAAQRKEDHLNNTEFITIDNPTPGTYTIQVKASVLSTAVQSFSLAYYMQAADTFTWDYPTSSDILQATTQPYLRWQNGYELALGDLSIKYANGGWQPLATVPLSEEYYKLKLDDTTTIAQLKMVVLGKEYLSDTFAISKPITLKVANDCPESTVLNWGKLQNVTDYLLYQLQGDSLSPVLTTSDTFMVINKATNKANLWAVEPLLSASLKGNKSFTVNVTNQNAGCYLTNFLVNLASDNTVEISLNINVPSQISTVKIIKLYQNNEVVLEAFNPTNTSYLFKDYDVKPGISNYYAEITTLGNELMRSEILPIYFANESSDVIFPNPSTDDFINIITAYSGGTLQLLNEQGAFLKNYELVNIIETLDLTGNPPGVYLYRIYFNGSVVSSGRFLKL